MQGGPLEHVIAAKAVAFHEALQPAYKTYIQQVIHNAAAFSDAFKEKGYDVLSGGTDNHLVLLNLHSKGITGKDAENALIKADITVNKNMVPFDTEKPTITSGIRIGAPAVTTRGFNENDCREVVGFIDEVLMNMGNENKIEAVKKAVNEKMKHFALYEGDF
jgi:glycine hydroxymethyltransferase